MGETEGLLMCQGGDLAQSFVGGNGTCPQSFWDDRSAAPPVLAVTMMGQDWGRF